LFPGKGLNVVSAHQARASPEVMLEKMKLGHEAVLNQRGKSLRDVAQFSIAVAGHKDTNKKPTIQLQPTVTDLPRLSLTVGTPDGSPPELCKSLQQTPKFPACPGLNFCPAPDVQAMRAQMAQFFPVPQDMVCLDAMFILEVIRPFTNLSMHIVNLGAGPSSKGENDKRQIVQGDDTTALNHAGWHSMNYDIPATAEATRSFYQKFGNRAQVDTTGEVEPHLIGKHLISHGVPHELDFLKVDIDSFECEYLEALLLGGFKPKLIDVEVAASYPPPIKFRARYTAGSGVSKYAAKLSATPFSGCSLQEVMDLVKPFNYTLLQFPMEDAWLVKDEFAHLF
jgi:hypothetical protein